MSIGDGTNDVPMIQEAQIGVGISGKEGREAVGPPRCACTHLPAGPEIFYVPTQVNNSDFAIAQFKFVKTLMMIHGRWDYRRICKVVVYSFYKNIVLTIILFYFATDSAFSGQSLYEDYVYAGYNFFLGMPILLVGFFDQVRPAVMGNIIIMLLRRI